MFWYIHCWLAGFNNISVISWQSVLSVEETRVPGENHPSVTSHWQTLSHNVVLSTSPWTGFEPTTLVVIGTDCIGSCISNYHTITATTAPWLALKFTQAKIFVALYQHTSMITRTLATVFCEITNVYSNMTPFKRVESKPVVKIILLYDRLNLWRHRQFVAISYQFLHIRIEIIHGLRTG